MSSTDVDYFQLLDNEDDDYLFALSLQTLEEEYNSYENQNKDNNKDNNKHIESDYEFALQLSKTYENQIEDNNQNKSIVKNTNISIVSPELELSDPSPNIWHLMRQFDDQFFDGILSKHCIELSWSSRMTRTAGLCCWNPNNRLCSIRLSLPLLQLRSRRDLVETLIHEMIHALLFVTNDDDNHESHGKTYHKHMYRINKESGTNITVYHTFNDEVDYYLNHIWRCDGICRQKAPYYGYVKRSMNRKPGTYDYWFKYHQQSCGGNFVKISEPVKNNTRTPDKNKVSNQPLLDNKDIRDYFSPTNKKKDNYSSNSLSSIVPFTGNGIKLGSDKSTISSKSNKSSDKSKSRLDDYKMSTTGKTATNSNNVFNNNESVSEIRANVQTISSVNTSKDANVSQIGSTITPFSGKGHKLGSIDRFLKSKDEVLAKKSKSIQSKTSSNKSDSKKIIEVIQLD